MLNESELRKLLEVAENATTDNAQLQIFYSIFAPSTGAELVREVLRLRQALKDTKEDAESAAIESRWQSSQGEDYGTY